MKQLVVIAAFVPAFVIERQVVVGREGNSR